MGASRLPRDAKLPNPCRETNVSGANGDREIVIFPVQPTTSRIGNLARLIHTLLLAIYNVMTTHKNRHDMYVLLTSSGATYGVHSIS